MKTKTRTTALCLCAALVGSISIAIAADKPHLVSRLRDGPITADGRFDDWYGALQPIGDAPIAVQALNDGDFLYVRVTASAAATRLQIVRQGFTVWFDPGGGTKKKFGIRYPVVEDGGRGGFGGRARGRGRGDEDDRADPGDTPSRSERVDILGPGKDDARSLTRDHLSGVDVAVRAEQGTLQYELKVPLARSSDHPYAIDTQPGKTIGVGFETEKMQQRSFGEGRGGGFGGGRPGRGGGAGRGGGMGGRRGGGADRGFQPPKPLKAWATVAIAPPVR